MPPHRDEDGARDRDARIPGNATERCPEMLAEILEHEPADACPRVQRREDEERLEHDGKVIPERHRRAPA